MVEWQHLLALLVFELVIETINFVKQWPIDHINCETAKAGLWSQLCYNEVYIIIIKAFYGKIIIAAHLM